MARVLIRVYQLSFSAFLGFLAVWLETAHSGYWHFLAWANGPPASLLAWANASFPLLAWANGLLTKHRIGQRMGKSPKGPVLAILAVFGGLGREGQKRLFSGS